MKTHSLSLRDLIIFGASFALFAAGLHAPATAATHTWDANAATVGVTDGAGTWNTTAGNTVWWDGAANSIWSNSGPNDAIFGSGNGAAGTVTIGSAITAGNLTFNPAGSGNYTLQGAANVPSNTITLSGAAPTITTNASATIAALVNSTNGFIKEGLGTLTLQGSTANVTQNVIGGTITVNAGTLVIGPQLNNSSATGAFQGNLTLANFGRLRMAQGDIIGDSSRITVGVDAFAEFGAGGAGGESNLGGLAGAGRIFIPGGRSLGPQSGTHDFTGVISGAGGLFVKSGSGNPVNQILSGANLHAGGTLIQDGAGNSLTLNNVNAVQSSTLSGTFSATKLVFGLPGPNTYNVGALLGSGSISLGQNTISLGATNLGGLCDAPISGSGGVTKLGTGVQMFREVNTYTGTTKIGGGTFRLLENGALSASSVINFEGTGVFDTNGGNRTLGTVNRLAGNATFGSIYDNLPTSLTLTSLTPGSAESTANFVVSGGTNGTSNKIVVSNAAPDALIDRRSFFNGDNFAWNDAAGYVRAIRYSGPPDAGAVTAAGGASLASATHQQITGAVTAQTDATFTTLKIAGPHAFTLAPAQTATVNSILKTGTNATLSGGTGIQASVGEDLIVRTNLLADALTINTPILANDGNALVKAGLGSLTLGPLAVNTYTGRTFVHEGTLIFSQDSNFGQSAAGPSAPSNRITLNGGKLQPAANVALSADHGIDIDLAGGAIFGNGFGVTLGSADMLSGSGPLAITGSSPTNTVVTSSAAQDYTGRMTIGAGSFFAGRIALGADNLSDPFGTGDITVITGGAGSAVFVNRPGSVWNNRFTISGDGAEGRGVIRTQQGGTFHGDIVLAENAGISSDGAGTTTTLNGNISGPFVLTLGGLTGANATNEYVLTGNNVHSATIVGLGITRIDHDTALGAYHGTTTLRSGATLRAGAGGIVLNPDRTIALTGGGLHTLDAQGFSLFVRGLITGSAGDSLVLRGTAIRLSAANTYAGPTVIEGGTVIVDTLGNSGAPSSLGLGSPTPAAADLILRDATLEFAPTVPIITDRLFTIAGTSATLAPVASSPPVSFTNPNAIGHSGTAARRLVLGGNNAGENRFTPSLRNAGFPQDPTLTSLTKRGPNTWIVDGLNTFTGTTEIDGGTLALASTGALGGTSEIAVNTGGTLQLRNAAITDRINNAARLRLAGGSISIVGNVTEGSSPGIGALTLTANSVIDFGGGDGSLHFSDSYAETWTGTLSIFNWTSGSDHLLIGTVDHPWNGTDGGLTASQLAQIAFYSGPGTGFLGTGEFLTGGSGEVVWVVPEPSSSVLVGLALIGLAGRRDRRKSPPQRCETGR